MSGERRRRVEQLFHSALKLPSHQRNTFLSDECGDDRALYDEVSALVSHHEATNAFVDQAPIDRIGAGFSSVPHPPIAIDSDIETDTSSFHIKDVLGEGGMGIVYLAEQSRPIRRDVALKLIKMGIDSKQASARFESERQALALMNHANIAGVHEAGSTRDGRLYFAMEYVPGSTITDYCDEQRLSIRQRLRLFVDVCHAVHHAHQKGIIHRDIKPSNILVSADDEQATPKIIDFGVAKATEQRLVEHSLMTQQGVLVGSLGYMSPEQADPSVVDIDTRSDIYSLGVVLYELLVGVHALDLGTPSKLSYAEIERRIQHQVPMLVSHQARELGDATQDVARRRSCQPATLTKMLRGDLDWITAKALEKDPHRRYSSASEFAADIERYLANEPVLAGAPSRAYRMRKFVTRNRGLVGAVTAITVTLAMGFATSTFLFLENRTTTRIAQEQRDDILMLSDINRLDGCIAAADSLGRPFPENIAEYEAWLDGTARELAERLGEHQKKLRELERGGVAVAAAAGGGFRFPDPETQFQYDFLAPLVERLEAFVDEDPGVGTMASVRKRLDLARRIRQESVEAYQAEWADAIRSIANPVECPEYNGLRLTPQVGLVPVGPDPATGFWEFAVVGTGEVPLRDDEGQIIVTEEMGVVMVLLPGGCFWLGAMREPHPNPMICSGDSLAEYKESPPDSICLDPFFMSKYEVTQGAWVNIMGVNPSGSKPGVEWEGYVQDLRHPVENVSWFDAMRATRFATLDVPTEAQWEYAARAGTASRFPCGWDKRCVAKYANVLDQSAKRAHKPPAWRFEAWDDGYVETSPAGAFLPNAFGLHDVLGNVGEWVKDPLATLDVPVRAGDGYRLEDDLPTRMFKGGMWTGGADGARPFRRLPVPKEVYLNFGVRPSRAIVASGE